MREIASLIEKIDVDDDSLSLQGHVFQNCLVTRFSQGAVALKFFLSDF